MNKYNIKVLVPIINKSYELFVPNNILVGNLLYMIVNSINDINDSDISNLLLYNSSNGQIIDLNDYVFNAITNGMTLILA